MQSMTSTRPYMIRAIYEWLEDNGHTPFMQVDATQVGVDVPRQYVTDGIIVLNIGSGAVQGLSITDEAVSFSARFNAIPMNIYVPISAVRGIYSRDNNLFGIDFELMGDIVPPKEYEGDPEPDGPGPEPKRDGKPSLRVIK